MMLHHNTSLEHNYGQLAKPLHIQQVEQALQLEPFLSYVEEVINKPPVNSEYESTDSEYDVLQPMIKDEEGSKTLNGVTITKAERKADKTRLYNFSKVKKSRRWLRNILLSDSSSDEDEEKPITNEDLQTMLKIHKYQRKHQMMFYQDNEHHQHQYYSTGLLSNYDKYHEHQKHFLGPKKKMAKEQRKQEKKLKVKLKKLKKERLSPDSSQEDEIDPSILEAIIAHRRQEARGEKKLSPEQADIKRKKLWITIAKKEIPKAQKQKAAARKEILQTLKKVSQQCMREVRKAAIQSQKTMKETQSRAKRLTREMVTYWKRFEKVEKEHRKRAEKEALEQRKMDLELREARRQQRKLNFLITQTELYAHFMAKKMTGESEERQDEILHQLDESKPQGHVAVSGGVLTDSACDDYDSERMMELALRNAEDAYLKHQDKNSAFKMKPPEVSMESSFANPSISTDADRPQPSIFEGTLKPYQLKGMNWLANLYDQGINGILADEMGLGKTVQSIAFLGHLSEGQGIWGPFLIIAPASTLHNWQQECARFCPRFKVVPYWGNSQDRRILRKFWDSQNLHQEEASFHVVITSYQLVIQDVKYFQRIKWQYMILDEAQAIKSSSRNYKLDGTEIERDRSLDCSFKSYIFLWIGKATWLTLQDVGNSKDGIYRRTYGVRWKILLDFNCRNRLLLTGTPIQNSMAELWALLHFIMPTMFDSHEEFTEWFSKDIESHAEKQSGIDENQLTRLRMILQPFMLRRVKKDVENELSDKIEILVYCPLTTRQKLLYQGIKNKISIEDLLSSSSSSSSAQNTASSLMNLVMQFRKVCNHSELFERREVKSPFSMKREPYTVPKLVYRQCIQDLHVSSKQKILYNLFNVFSTENICQSMCSQCSNTSVNSLFSFTKFVDISPKELHNYMFGGLLVRWLGIFLMMKMAYSIHHHRTWHDEEPSHHLDRRSFLLYTNSPMSFTNVHSSPVLSNLVFTSYTSNFFAFENHTLHCMKETQEHCKLRHRSHKKKNPFSPPHSPTKSPSHHPIHHDIPFHHKYRPPRVLKCQPTELPSYLYYSMPKVHASSSSWESHDRSAAWQIMKENLCGTLEARQSLLYGTPEIYTGVRWWNPWYFSKVEPGGLFGFRPKHGMSGVYSPDKESLVTDAGKLFVMDTLLQRLKSEGHRVLIYSQMTRMIDLLEEYMWHRKHTYIRLDGSSKISERRDMVADFQARTDIFVFLLSTRAGGLGINLTAADTVIFYDSDWNPTVDQQAMDRAHRLGQTKQVTVYRLVCKGTIEERILQRAKEKSEIQRMVISGGSYRPDVLKPKEVVSLLIDDDEMERKLMQKADEKGPSKDDTAKDKDRKRKREYVKKRDPKKSKQEDSKDNNVTIAADTESQASFDSTSVPASPQSVMSYGSEMTQQSGIGVDDSSNDALVIVDDPLMGGSTQALTTPTKRGSGKRGRPKGSTGTRRPRGRGLKKALSAAEIAGAQAGLTAAYAAYGYNFTGTSNSPSNKSNSPCVIGDSPRATNSPQDAKKQ